MTTQDRSFTTWLWDFFCSLKLSIFLLLILAILSIIGTIIPQVPLRPEYLNSISPTKFKLYDGLGFFDMYHSWWFMFLLFMLTINLVACSIKRLPRVWKMVKEPTLVMDEGLEKSLTLTHHFKSSKDAHVLKEILSTEFAPAVVTTVGDEQHLFAQKQAYSRLGVYVVHSSIIIIFIGAILGTFFGFKGYVQIEEGTAESTIYLQRPPAILTLKNYFTHAEDLTKLTLPYSVRCDDFSMSFYDTGEPKEYKSILTILAPSDNGGSIEEKVKAESVIVNDPLTYKGITFYQSGYDQTGVRLYLNARSRRGGQTQQLIVNSGETAQLPGGGMVRIVGATDEVSPYRPGFFGPAFQLEVARAGGAPEIYTIMQNYPNYDDGKGSLVFAYGGAEAKMSTGLQVAKDPGVWVVWTGCFLMMVGTYMAFFMSHRRIWIRVSKGHVTIGGTASKNPAGFELNFETLLDTLKKP